MGRHEPVDEDDGEGKTRSRRTDDKQQGNQPGDTVAEVLDQVLCWMLFICKLKLTTLCSGSRL